jgi:hypothetical protein
VYVLADFQEKFSVLLLGEKVIACATAEIIDEYEEKIIL